MKSLFFRTKPLRITITDDLVMTSTVGTRHCTCRNNSEKVHLKHLTGRVGQGKEEQISGGKGKH